MSSSYLFKDRSELDTEVDLSISDEDAATGIYGDINTWDVSAIIDFSNLFENEEIFNSYLINLDLSN